LRRDLATSRPVERVLLLGVPIVATAFLVVIFLELGRLGYDFRYGAWPAADRFLHGMSPYGLGGWQSSGRVFDFVYPAPAVLLYTPLGLIPRDVATAIVVVAALACPLVSLRLVGVDDWRVYGLVFLWLPVVTAWQNSNLTMFLLPGVAALWAWRARPVASGVMLGFLVALKLYLWPLGLFLAATRRSVALGWAAATFAVLNLVSWPVIGFDEFGRYRNALRHFSERHEDDGLSIVGLVERLGGGRTLAYFIALALTLCVGLIAVWAGRRHRDEVSFVLALAASLLATPIVWLYYLSILVVAVPVLHPRLDWRWAVPLVLWVTARQAPETWQVIATLAVTAGLFCALLAPAARRAA
jgi:alpha-1,2-mannosyltransferase